MAKSDKQDLIPCTLEERGRNCIQYRDGRCALLLGSTNRQPCSFYKPEMALRAGMPLMQVSKLLGHAQIGTTQIYLDISDEELMQAHEKYVM